MSFSSSLDSSGSCVRFATLVSNASPASIIILSILVQHSSEWGARPSHPGQCRVLSCLSTMFSVEIHASRSHFRPFFCCTCGNEFVTDTVRNRIVGIPRVTKRKFSGHRCPRYRCQKVVSPLAFSVLTWCQQNELICFSFLLAKTLLFPSSAEQAFFFYKLHKLIVTVIL